MKKFITKTIMLSSLVFIIIVGFDLWLRNKNSSYKEKYDGLIKAKDSVQVLFLGNSHATYGIDPTQFDNFYSYNLANVDQSIYFDKRLTVKAIKKGMVNLKFVFISVDYHSLYHSSQGIRNIWSYYGNGIKYKDNNYIYPNISYFLWGYTPSASIFLLMKEEIFHRIRYPKNKTIDLFDIEDAVDVKDTIKQGFFGLSGTNSNSFRESEYIKRAKTFTEHDDSERVEVTRDLEDFISQLKSFKITPILFTAPTYKDYNVFLSKQTINKNLSDIKIICKKYNIDYWNYMNDSIFVKSDFYNCDHLNKEGAKKFSKLLSIRLNKYAQTHKWNKE